ncbi:MAG: PadR family transcriptional regulator [Gemmatimonadota bacterium]|nr:PadR family transcriptional regulator [Gemmatimonadota bacterium]
MPRASLGEFEQLVLLAVLRLRDGAFAPDVSLLLEREAGRGVSRGALYSSLSRLEEKGMLAVSVQAGDDTRGGYRKRRFEVTPAGVAALRNARDAWDRLAAGLDDVFREAG